MNSLVLGLQWGDEGKGKAIDYLTSDYNVIVRYQGGNNAGHTIYHKGKKVVLHLLPSGILTPGTISVISSGVVVDPAELKKEIELIEKDNLELGELVISKNAPLILPLHRGMDEIFENSRYIKIGTTKRGIGPSYEDLTGRRAVFFGDLLDEESFIRKVKTLNTYYNKLISVYGGETIDPDTYIDEYVELGRYFKDRIKNTTYFLNACFREGKKILFEGAQGALLDICHGTYPFVTSSNPTVGGIFTGTGLSHKAVDNVIGITKAYTTRVGEGPFPSELEGEASEDLRARGNEYGATTGRPRRVGWLDLVALKYAIMINGVDKLFLTKLDVLDGMEKVSLITDYKYRGEATQVFDQDPEFLREVECVERSFDGWDKSSGTEDFDNLPENAKKYISFIEKYTGVKVAYISNGTGRSDTIKV